MRVFVFSWFGFSCLYSLKSWVLYNTNLSHRKYKKERLCYDVSFFLSHRINWTKKDICRTSNCNLDLIHFTTYRTIANPHPHWLRIFVISETWNSGCENHLPNKTSKYSRKFYLLCPLLSDMKIFIFGFSLFFMINLFIES